MAFRDVGNPPLHSTGVGSSAIGVNASSGAVVAAIVGLQDRLYEVRFAVGADTVAYWKLQHTSSGGTVKDRLHRHQRIGGVCLPLQSGSGGHLPHRPGRGDWQFLRGADSSRGL
jgi:hypothetical protein